MNNDPPFNPLLPPDFGLNPQSESVGQSHASASAPAHQQTKQARKTTRPRRARSANGTGKNCWSRWDRIKGRLTAKLVTIDQERLKRVLLGCGIAVGLVAAIILAIKLLPVALTILTLLGIALALQVWDRLRRFPPPPF